MKTIDYYSYAGGGSGGGGTSPITQNDFLAEENSAYADENRRNALDAQDLTSSWASEVAGAGGNLPKIMALDHSLEARKQALAQRQLRQRSDLSSSLGNQSESLFGQSNSAQNRRKQSDMTFGVFNPGSRSISQRSLLDLPGYQPV